MSNRDVVHQWQPSERLRRLIAMHGGIPVSSHTSTNALLWVREHARLFPSRQSSARLLTILQYQFNADLTIDDLRDLVARSWVHSNRVQGALGITRNLGVKLFAELQHVVMHAD